ncbi:MAG: protein kinase [Lysobacterales bacterium]
MPSTRIWVQANRIFDQISRLDGDQRSRRAIALCRDNSDLEECVQRLLEADKLEATEAYTDPPAHRIRVPDPQLIGQRIGPYRVQRQIGEGGMGGVFLASRIDPGHPREVAIKVLKPGLDQRRFVLERQLLEKLNHTHIARLVDGGELADGRPFVVMEHIEGQRITRYARHLPLKPVLVLFRTLCLAVAHSHAMLVVHRDIKPANVLVSEDGTLKLLDFGIAKLMAGNSELAAVSTASQLRPMTPEYSSPEQLLGEPISTRTDVYLLGLLLHELLSGTNPLKGLSQGQRLLDISQDTVPPPPSRMAVTDAPLNGSYSRLQRIDLDRITQKALRISPDRRYQSVNDLVQDIDNVLEGRPVKARGNSKRYQFAKFLVRNPVACGLSAAVAVLLLSVALISAHHSQVLERQMERIRAEHQRTESVTNLLIESFAQADPTRHHAGASAKDLLLKAAHRLEQGLSATPENLARLRLAVAAIMSRLGMFAEAGEQLNKVAALDGGSDNMPSNGSGDSPTNASGITQKQRFEMHRLQAHLGIETRRWVLARSHLEAARSTLGQLSRSPDDNAALVDLEVYSARIHTRQGNSGAATMAYETALNIARQYTDSSAKSLAYIELEFSEMLLANGEEKRAHQYLEQAHNSAPQILESAPFWIQMLRAQARDAIRRGDYRRALVVYNRGLARAGQHFGPRSEEVASMLSGMGTANERLGHRSVANALNLMAFDISRSRALDGDFILVQRSLNLAQLLAFEGHHREAALLLGEQLDSHYRLNNAPDPQVPVYEQALARFNLNSGNSRGAKISYRNALLVNQDLPFSPARERFDHQALCEISILNGYDWRGLPARLLESCLPSARKNLLHNMYSDPSGSPHGVTMPSRFLEELD